MKKYTCVILDDEPLAHEIIESYIQKSGTFLLQSKYLHANEAKKAIELNKPDLLFLDIEMPSINGLDFLQSLVHKPITIITTAYRQYALDGFDAGVVDYLLKPIKYPRFEQASTRAKELLDLIHANEQLDESSKNEPETIIIKSGTKFIKIPLDSITHVQGLKDYAIIYAGSAKHVVLGYMKIVESKLPEGLFVRVHKSFIVAKNQINLIKKGKIYIGEHQIPIGRSYKKAMDEYMGSSFNLQ